MGRSPRSGEARVELLPPDDPARAAISSWPWPFWRTDGHAAPGRARSDGVNGAPSVAIGRGSAPIGSRRFAPERALRPEINSCRRTRIEAHDVFVPASTPRGRTSSQIRQAPISNPQAMTCPPCGDQRSARAASDRGPARTPEARGCPVARQRIRCHQPAPRNIRNDRETTRNERCPAPMIGRPGNVSAASRAAPPGEHMARIAGAAGRAGARLWQAAAQDRERQRMAGLHRQRAGHARDPDVGRQVGHAERADRLAQLLGPLPVLLRR